jgi:hypothetical protein
MRWTLCVVALFVAVALAGTMVAVGDRNVNIVVVNDLEEEGLKCDLCQMEQQKRKCYHGKRWTSKTQVGVVLVLDCGEKSKSFMIMGYVL